MSTIPEIAHQFVLSKHRVVGNSTVKNLAEWVEKIESLYRDNNEDVTCDFVDELILLMKESIKTVIIPNISHDLRVNLRDYLLSRYRLWRQSADTIVTIRERIKHIKLRNYAVEFNRVRVESLDEMISALDRNVGTKYDQCDLSVVWMVSDFERLIGIAVGLDDQILEYVNSMIRKWRLMFELQEKNEIDSDSDDEYEMQIDDGE